MQPEALLEVLLDNYYYMPDLVIFRFDEARFIMESYAKYYKNGRILDIGCGDGIFGSLVIEKPIDVGIDVSESDLKLNRLNSAKYRYLSMTDAQKISFKNETFGLVFSNCVIEHIKDLNSVLNQVRNILTVSGKFIFTVPNPEFKQCFLFPKLLQKLGLKNLAECYATRRLRRLRVVHLFDIQKWKNILNGCGLNLVEYKYYLSSGHKLLFAFFNEVVSKPLGLTRHFRPLKKIVILLLNPILKNILKNEFPSSGMGLCIVVEKK